MPGPSAPNFLRIFVKKLGAGQLIQGELLDFGLDMPDDLADGRGRVLGTTRRPPLGSF